MRALVKGEKSVSVAEIARPVLESEGHVLISVRLAGLCRTDVYVAEGKIKSKDNVILGHEFSGVVEQAGSAANDFAPGDRVTAMPVMPCCVCAICTSGRQDKCQSTTMLGIDYDGAFAEYISVPASAVYKIPDTVSFRQGAYSEPVAASLSVIKAGILPEQKGMIYGDNRFGHLISRILKAYGFKNMTIFDPRGTQKIEDNTFDFAVETMATSEAMDEIFRMVKPGGKVVIKSRKHDPVGINFNTAVKKEITLCAVNYGDFREAIQLMADGRLPVDDLLGDVYKLEDFEKVFERSKTLETTKVFFAPGKDDVRDR